MNPKDREASLAKIKSSSSTRVILISFKAGSTGTQPYFFYGDEEVSLLICDVGLNLTACNNVILVDLWWNPALEVYRKMPDTRLGLIFFSLFQDQAFDRSHRFGQTRDVNIFKLKIDGTVEDRILLVCISCHSVIHLTR